MSEIQPFTFPATGQPVRTVLINGEPHFVLTDAAKILNYRDAEKAARLLRDSQLSTLPEGTWRDLGGRGSAPKIVTEGGLYRLIMRSNSPLADPFQDWVTDEVLPAIRRTGSYGVAPQRELSRKEMARFWYEAEERAEAAEQRAAELEGPARSWEILASGKGDISVADAAKILSRDPAIKIGRDRLFQHMGENGWTFRQRRDGRWRAYQTQVNNGRLSELPQEYENPKTGELTLGAPQVRVKIKGLRELHHQLGGVAPLRLGEQLAIGGE